MRDCFHPLNKFGVDVILINARVEIIMAMCKREDDIYDGWNWSSCCFKGSSDVSIIGCSYLIIEGDSLAIVEVISSNYEKLSHYGMLIREIKLLLSYFWYLEIVNVVRQINVSTHDLLVGHTRSTDSTLQWWQESPEFLASSLVADVVVFSRGWCLFYAYNRLSLFVLLVLLYFSFSNCLADVQKIIVVFV